MSRAVVLGQNKPDSHVDASEGAPLLGRRWSNLSLPFPYWPTYVREAVKFYWQTRAKQVQSKERRWNGSGPALRCYWRAQMDGFIELFTKLVIEAGMTGATSFYRRASWSFRAIFVPPNSGILSSSSKANSLQPSSQVSVGPSFATLHNSHGGSYGKCFRFMDSIREKWFGTAIRPWIGSCFLLEDCPKSRAPVWSRSRLQSFPNSEAHRTRSAIELFCRPTDARKTLPVLSLLIGRGPFLAWKAFTASQPKTSLSKKFARS